jgi:hypothetical protein
MSRNGAKRRFTAADHENDTAEIPVIVRHFCETSYPYLRANPAQ